jgi:mitogen-activated protein kinase binding protein 1
VYDLTTMQPVPSVTSAGLTAHEAEILTLSYSPYIPSSVPASPTDAIDKDLVLLASGGRDRLVHVFDASDGAQTRDRYSLLTTLDNHSSSVTVTKFNSDGSRLVSCGGDKTMVLNSVKGREVSRVRSIQTPHGTINGMALDTATSKFAISSGQDKRVNVWNMNSGKLVRTYRPEGVQGELFKCAMDPSGECHRKLSNIVQLIRYDVVICQECIWPLVRLIRSSECTTSFLETFLLR